MDNRTTDSSIPTVQQAIGGSQVTNEYEQNVPNAVPTPMTSSNATTEDRGTWTPPAFTPMTTPPRTSTATNTLSSSSIQPPREPSPTITSGINQDTRTLDQLVMADHNEIRDLWNKYMTVSAQDPNAAQRWYNLFLWHVSKHNAAEELVLFPYIEKNFGDQGKKYIDASREHHKNLKVLLANAESEQYGSSKFMQMMQQVDTALSQQFQGEESAEIPLLLSQASEQERVSYGKKYARTKYFVPTRPHIADGSPAFVNAVGLLLAPVDRLRDMFRTFPEND